MATKQTIEKMDYHRNGVCGLGFHVAIVDEVEDGQRRKMLVIRFPAESDKDAGGVLCAAFNIEKLAQQDIAFGSNSWRSDYYSDVIDAELKRRES